MTVNTHSSCDPGYVPSEAIATHQQDTNANVLPARNTVSSLYLTTQQPGDHGNPAATQPNVL